MKNLDSNDPKRLDGLTPQQILEEIGQIATQYLKEFPSNGRVAWPESIRARILALARLGVPRKKIAELTPVPAATIFLWCKGMPGIHSRGRPAIDKQARALIPQLADGSFIELPTDPKRSVVGLESKRTFRDTEDPRLPGLRISTPQGFELSGLNSIEELVSVYRELIR
jgi:hypothetical protein